MVKSMAVKSAVKMKLKLKNFSGQNRAIYEQSRDNWIKLILTVYI